MPRSDEPLPVLGGGVPKLLLPVGLALVGTGLLQIACGRRRSVAVAAAG
jgi:hypothetical protein